ncbi:hypothetical protein HNV12_17930 [Methanococcoides sp. SA1]|nr:hypothetical protein [Methanococcoides sp. SA1]
MLICPPPRIRRKRFHHTKSARNAQSSRPPALRDITRELRSKGYYQDEIGTTTLAMSHKGPVRLEIWAPITESKEELKDITITRGYNRFAYISLK